MKYFLATYELLDGEHEHKGAMIIVAKTFDEACKIAEVEEYSPDIEYSDEEWEEGKFRYFDFGGDGTTAAHTSGVHEISQEQMEFLERVGLAYRK